MFRSLPRLLHKKLYYILLHQILESTRIHMLHYFLLIFCVTSNRRRFIARLERDEMEALLRRFIASGGSRVGLTKLHIGKFDIASCRSS